ncbi:unnamed protein product [Protopolystoma xenopodis]|uniref:Uncharacterized protein n=1 Tax=Protopolystoma xenopodis TaxID=117903 RepID=A0A448XEX2_9PLAT|nr:unnamed protein product [Protopolystoma xenopodis]
MDWSYKRQMGKRPNVKPTVTIPFGGASKRACSWARATLLFGFGKRVQLEFEISRTLFQPQNKDNHFLFNLIGLTCFEAVRLAIQSERHMILVSMSSIPQHGQAVARDRKTSLPTQELA